MMRRSHSIYKSMWDSVMKDRICKRVVKSSPMNKVEEFYKTNLFSFKSEKEVIFSDTHKMFYDKSDQY